MRKHSDRLKTNNNFGVFKKGDKMNLINSCIVTSNSVRYFAKYL